MSGSIVRRFSRCACDRVRSLRSLSSDPIGFRRYSAGPEDDDEEVTEEELKRRIQRFYDGDGEALPSIFEAILKRKLAGKNDEGLIDQLPICGRPDLTDSSGESSSVKQGVVLEWTLNAKHDEASHIYSSTKGVREPKASILSELRKIEELGKGKVNEVL